MGNTLFYQPQVTIVVPNLNSPIIHDVLDSLRFQDYRGDYEVIVIGIDVHNLIIEDDLISFLDTSQPVSPAIARNLGIKLAKGEILAFIDSDCLAAPDWLSRLIEPYRDPAISVVGGGVTFPDDHFWTYCDNLATFYEYLVNLPPGEREQLPSLNLSIRKTALENVGLFDERYPLPAGEDADLTTRLSMFGYQLLFEPLAKITHLPRRNGPQEVLMHAYNFGRFSVKVDHRYRDILEVPLLLRNSLTAFIFSPFFAAAVLLKMRTRGVLSLQLGLKIPVLFAIKIAWCLGASNTLRNGNGIGS